MSYMNTYDVMNKYLSEVEIVLAENTAKYYRSILTEFARLCNNEQADRDKVVQYMRTLKERGNSNNSIRVKINVVKTFVKWATDNGCYDTDFAAGVPLPGPEYKTADRMTKSEVKTLLHMDAKKGAHQVLRNKAIMELAIVTASRVSAICALTRDDVDLVNKTVTFRHTKRNKELVMPLTNSLCKTLTDYIYHARPKELTDKDPLFTGEHRAKDGTYKAMSRNAVYLICKALTEQACGRALSPHKLRHTSASLQIESGKLTIDEISQNLGHSSVTTTQRYAKRLNDTPRKTATVAVFEEL